MNVDARLSPELEGRVASAVERARAERVFDRIWQQDVTLWAPEGTPELADRLGWLRVAEATLAAIDEIEAFVDEVRDAGMTDVVLLGMGGSSLAPEVFRRSYPDAPGLRLHVLDTTEPLQVLAVERQVDLETTLFIVSSKSGGTIEPNSLFKHFYGLRPDGSHFVAITDPGTQMGRSRASTTSAARSSTTPTSAGGTPRCRTSASCRRRWRASTSARSSPRRWRPRTPRRRTPGCISVASWARSPTRAATS
jgi:hypothetical protein